MMMINYTNTIWNSEIKLLSSMIIVGILFSGMVFVMLTEGVTSPILSENYETLCDTGLCLDPVKGTDPIAMFIQQNYESDSEVIKQNSEDFSTFKIEKYSNVDPELTDNSAIIYSTKDSFVREGIKTSNEGSNEVLRIMGTGPINNRILIGFDDVQLNAVLEEKTLDSAKLKMFVVDNDGKWEKEQTVIIRSLTKNWQEGIETNAPFVNSDVIQKGVTWNCPSKGNDCINWNGGSFETISTDSIVISNEISEKWIEFDVTKDILAYMEDTPNYGWIVMKNDEESPGRINVAARETQTNIPQLELIFK